MAVCRKRGCENGVGLNKYRQSSRNVDLRSDWKKWCYLLLRKARTSTNILVERSLNLTEAGAPMRRQNAASGRAGGGASRPSDRTGQLAQLQCIASEWNWVGLRFSSVWLEIICGTAPELQTQMNALSPNCDAVAKYSPIPVKMPQHVFSFTHISTFNPYLLYTYASLILEPRILKTNTTG